ncbi:MAG TPA: adenosylhomocysteinase [Solirubrobacteraceae bacterium]|jgi:adenosylhomocysteinase|nr:adenosylhomocysteinase [Solirubrobacteraceae bacterium]
MARTAVPPHDVADLGLAPDGELRIEWAAGQMPVLAQIRARFITERPLEGIRVAACLHVTAETANLVRTLTAGGATVALCSANPLSAQDDVAAALVLEDGVEVRARRGEDVDTYVQHVLALLGTGDETAPTHPQITLDDGADLIATAHARGGEVLDGLIGGTEETTTGLVRLRRLQEEGTLRCPVLAVNEARTERALNDRHGTGQSALDGIVRASNVLLAGNTVVVIGYGWAGLGVAERARGAGAAVIVCEIDPLRALEARMAGYQVMPALEAAERGDIFITVTGSRRVLHGEHFARMKDGALLANAGHFDVELDLGELEALASGGHRAVRPLVEEYRLADGRRINLLAHGRVVNLAAAEGHPAAVMDVSFALQALSVEQLVVHRGDLAPGVHSVPAGVDREVGRLKLAALGVRIDEPTAEQQDYRQSWA